VTIRRLLGALIVAICIGVPFVESFDTWDHTARDGNDTEANVVVAALCVGLTLSASAPIVVRTIRGIPTDTRLEVNTSAPAPLVSALLLSPRPAISPPPVALRI
jgi:hypothetical protein